MGRVEGDGAGGDPEVLARYKQYIIPRGGSVKPPPELAPMRSAAYQVSNKQEASAGEGRAGKRRRVYRERYRRADDQLVWLLDLNIVPLVRTLNGLAGVETVTSCGGHANPGPTQYRLGSWYVKFRVGRDPEGQRSLTLLAWLINNRAVKGGRDLLLFPYAVRRGAELTFVLEGHNGEDPDALARQIARARRRGGQ